MNWNFSSGIKFSSPTGFYYYQGNSVPIYSKKNNSRLPDYHRMDISTSFSLNKNKESKFKHSIQLSIYNLYGRENPISINYNKIETGNGNFSVPSNIISENKIVPTSIYLFNAIPSITYLFKFK